MSRSYSILYIPYSILCLTSITSVNFRRIKILLLQILERIISTSVNFGMIYGFFKDFVLYIDIKLLSITQHIYYHSKKFRSYKKHSNFYRTYSKDYISYSKKHRTIAILVSILYSKIYRTYSKNLHILFHNLLNLFHYLQKSLPLFCINTRF